MGGCATKPKVLNPETTTREAPSDLPAAAEPAAAEEIEELGASKGAEEAGELGEKISQINVQSEADTVVKEIVDADDNGDKAAGEEEQDQHGNFKRRSLSHLFKENEEGNDSIIESEKTSSETVVVKAEPLENEKAKEELEKKMNSTKDAENSETTKHEPILVPEVIDAPQERVTKANLAEEKSSQQVEDESAKVIASEEKNEKEVPEGEKTAVEESAKVKTFEEQNEKEIFELEKATNEREEESAKVITSEEKNQKETSEEKKVTDVKESST